MCDVRERGDGAAAVSGWSKGRREKDTGRLNPNEGAFLQTESASVSPADGLLSVESWGVGAKSFPCAQGGPFFIPYFTSPHPQALLHSVLFAVVLRLTMYLTFVNLFLRQNGEIVFGFVERVIFLLTGCFVLSEEQVGKLVVTGE